MWWEAIKALFLAIIGVSKAVEVRTKPQEVQISEHEIEKPRKTAQEIDRMLDKDFRELVYRTEMDIENYVNVVHDAMEDGQRKEYAQSLVERITGYRKKHRIIFRKWLKEKNLL